MGSDSARHTGLMAEEIGLDLVQVLDTEDLRIKSRDQDTADIPPNEMRSFRRADLVLETINEPGETGYVAVELSCSIDNSDTAMSIRNARYLTRFTERRCHAADAGHFRDRSIEGAIESGRMLSYESDSTSRDKESPIPPP